MSSSAHGDAETRASAQRRGVQKRAGTRAEVHVRTGGAHKFRSARKRADARICPKARHKCTGAQTRKDARLGMQWL
eukprot:378854-Pyramimonas_sp.AAC.1